MANLEREFCSPQLSYLSKMTAKTWFLPPDFTFIAGEQLALGMIISEPQRPTVMLASLQKHPNISTPRTTTIIEKGRSFTIENSRSFGGELFAKFLSIGSAELKADLSRWKNKSFSSVDHEIQMYSEPFAPETLEAILQLDSVKRHVESGRFGKRCTYVVSGLRIARESFLVTDEEGRNNSGSIGASGSAPIGALPLEAGGSLSADRGQKKAMGYETAPGVVFAYRLHVIRPKRSSTDAELFSDRTAFFSGEEEPEEVAPMEAIEVDAEVLRQDLDIEPDTYNEKKSKSEEGEAYITFNADKGLNVS
jgi:hypothetical protein